MKTINQSLCLLLAAAALTACDKEPQRSAEDATILLSAGVPTTVEVRAPIETGDSFRAAIAGWEVGPDAEAEVDYSLEPRWETATTVKAQPALEAVTLDQTQVYHANAAVRTYMKSWYPQGTLASGEVRFAADDADYVGDGTDDVLLARELVGRKNDRFDKALYFAHETVQLRFQVRGEISLEPGTEVRSIKINDVQVPVGISLVTDELLGSEAGQLPVPGVEVPVTIPIAADENSQADPATVGVPVMILPVEGQTLSLDIETNHAVYEATPFTIDEDTRFVPGKAYVITLTFVQQKIELSTSVAEWQPGTGSGKVE